MDVLCVLSAPIREGLFDCEWFLLKTLLNTPLKHSTSVADMVSPVRLGGKLPLNDLLGNYQFGKNILRFPKGKALFSRKRTLFGKKVVGLQRSVD